MSIEKKINLLSLEELDALNEMSKAEKKKWAPNPGSVQKPKYVALFDNDNEPQDEATLATYSFGAAMSLVLSQGKKVTRKKWGAIAWISKTSSKYAGEYMSDFVFACTLQGDFIPWTPTQFDMFAKDWEIFEYGEADA
jgi:hypothetical protein